MQGAIYLTSAASRVTSPMLFRALVVLLALGADAHAVILDRTGDPTANTTAPTGKDANSGWQYQGTWGGFLGTPIAPGFFISAAHIGNAGGSQFIFQSATYHTLRSYYDPQSDLVIWKVAEQFPTFAPLYSRTDEDGERMIVIGRGTQRGSAVMLNNVFKGWFWGAEDSVMRWGENVVADIVPNGPGFDLLRAPFDANGLPNECHLSVGDSGGAAFIQDESTWKLAAINYAVDGQFSTSATGSDPFHAALVDRSGYFQESSPLYEAVTGPSGFYVTRISTKLPWIGATIAEPRIGFEPGYVTLTYTRLILPSTDLHYVVQQSIDFVQWPTATTNDEILSSNGQTEVVKARVSLGSATKLFLRLSVERP